MRSRPPSTERVSKTQMPRTAASAMRALRRTYRLHFYHAIGFPSYLADELILNGNLVGWCVTLRPLIPFVTAQLPDHPDAADFRTLFASATSVTTLDRRGLADLVDWIAVRDDIWRRLRERVHFNLIIHRDASVLAWEARRRRTLDNLRYIAQRNVDPASTFAHTVVADWDLTASQILESGLEIGDQIVAWYRTHCEDQVSSACAEAILPPAVQQFLSAVRSHHH